VRKFRLFIGYKTEILTVGLKVEIEGEKISRNILFQFDKFEHACDLMPHSSFSN
jgi:hypothetical protein